MERSAPPAAAWTVSDGRAGNARQASALAAAMGLEARDWTLQASAPWRWLAPHRFPGARGAFGESFARALEAPPGVAIGCGRQAALATRLLRARGSRVVQVLDPRLAPSLWDVVVAPRHDRLRGDNVVTLLGSLHPVDDAWLAQARVAFATIGTLPRPRVALLVGGPTRHAPYDTAALQAWLRQVESLVAREGGSLLLCGSRRTPGAMRARLRDTAAGLRWLDATDGDNPYAGVLAWADRIACTPDSVNMLSEACATWAPVFIAGAGRAGAIRGRVGDFVDALAALDRIRPLDAAMARFEVQPLRETTRVAAEVGAKLR